MPNNINFDVDTYVRENWVIKYGTDVIVFCSEDNWEISWLSY